MAHAAVENISYLSGERLRVTFRLEPDEIPLFEVANVSAYIFRADVPRNVMVIGFGSAPARHGNSFSVEVNLPENAAPGLHFVASGPVFIGGQDSVEQMSVQFEPPIFEIRPIIAIAATEMQLKSRLEALLRQRQAFSERRLRTAAAESNTGQNSQYRVLVFAVGTMIHSNQQLEGYRISQLAGGMSHRQMLDLANSYVQEIGFGPIPMSDRVEQKFILGTPSIVVDYADIEARDHLDAITHCRHHADLVFLALGRDRGQVPKEFGFVAYERGAEQMWHGFHAPWYRGNLLPDFSASALAEAVEQMLPRLQSDPFARLISRSFVEASIATNDGEKIFRFWTIFELVADRRIVRDNTPLLHPGGAPILKPGGQPETNQSKVGRVYSYLRTLGDMATTATHLNGETTLEGGDNTHPSYQSGMRVFPLWEMVRSAYAVRNYIAHEGYFDAGVAAQGDRYQQLAAQGFTTGIPMIPQFVGNAASRVLWREA